MPWFVTLLFAAILSACSGSSSPSSTLGEVGVKLPPAPTNLQVSETGVLVTLSWDGSEAASSYNVYWTREEGKTAERKNKVDRIRKTSNTFRLQPNDTDYVYLVVTAVGTAGESEPSEEISFKADGNIGANANVAFSALPEISANGNTIIFLSSDCSLDLCLYRTTRTASGSWTEREVVMTASSDAAMSLQAGLSADGDVVIYSTDQGVMRVDYRSGEPVVEMIIEESVESFSVDHSGDIIAYERNDRVKLLDLSGTADVTFDVARGMNPKLSGDGSTLTLINNSGDLLVAGDANWESTTEIGTGDRSLISADGQTIILVTGIDSFDHLRREADTWTSTTATLANCCGSYLSLSADGKRLFMANFFTEFEGDKWSALATYDEEAGDFASANTDGDQVVYVKDGRLYLATQADDTWQIDQL